MRFRFVEEHRSSFPANRLCEVVGVSSRGLRAFRSRPASRRQRSDLITWPISKNNPVLVWAAMVDHA